MQLPGAPPRVFWRFSWDAAGDDVEDDLETMVDRIKRLVESLVVKPLWPELLGVVLSLPKHRYTVADRPLDYHDWDRKAWSHLNNFIAQRMRLGPENIILFLSLRFLVRRLQTEWVMADYDPFDQLSMYVDNSSSAVSSAVIEAGGDILGAIGGICHPTSREAYGRSSEILRALNCIRDDLDVARYEMAQVVYRVKQLVKYCRKIDEQGYMEEVMKRADNCFPHVTDGTKRRRPLERATLKDADGGALSQQTTAVRAPPGLEGLLRSEECVQQGTCVDGGSSSYAVQPAEESQRPPVPPFPAPPTTAKGMDTAEASDVAWSEATFGTFKKELDDWRWWRSSGGWRSDGAYVASDRFYEIEEVEGTDYHVDGEDAAAWMGPPKRGWCNFAAASSGDFANPAPGWPSEGQVNECVNRWYSGASSWYNGGQAWWVSGSWDGAWTAVGRQPPVLHDEDRRFEPEKKKRVYVCDGCWAFHGFWKRACPFQGQYRNQAALHGMSAAQLEKGYCDGTLDVTWWCSLCHKRRDESVPQTLIRIGAYDKRRVARTTSLVRKGAMVDSMLDSMTFAKGKKGKRIGR